MKFYLFLILTFTFSTFSCQKEDESSKDEEEYIYVSSKNKFYVDQIEMYNTGKTVKIKPGECYNDDKAGKLCLIKNSYFEVKNMFLYTELYFLDVSGNKVISEFNAYIHPLRYDPDNFTQIILDDPFSNEKPIIIKGDKMSFQAVGSDGSITTVNASTK